MIQKLLQKIKDLFTSKIDLTPGRAVWVEVDFSQEGTKVKLCQKAQFVKGTYGIVQNVKVDRLEGAPMRLKVSFEVRAMIDVKQFE